MIQRSQPLLLASLVAILSCSTAVALSVPKIQARILDGPETLRESYDYVIIGGGTAGLTVGDRLSEDGETTVLVIENGELANSDEINNVRDRVTWSAEPWWLYNITSGPNKELDNLESIVYAASVVGGGSALNGMQCLRGTKKDYDRWGSFFGRGSPWSWDGILPYFKKASRLFFRGLHFQPPSQETMDQMPGLKYDESYWGTTSRLYAGWPYFQWPGTSERLRYLPGVEVPGDSGAGQSGVYWYPTYMDAKGSRNRSYARTAHWDGLNRANYELLIWFKVHKIELDGNKATGVVFGPNEAGREDVDLTTVNVNKQVILSAGTIHSPQLLQLSGIGPRKLLESAGIETKVDLPGDNFTDPDFVAWAETIRSSNEVFYSHYFSGDEPVNYFTCEHPLSRGSININISAPESELIVDYRTYSSPADFDIMLELARFHRYINEESPLLVEFDPVETSPSLNTTSREEWVTYMRQNTVPTAMHPAGTCAMMPLELGGVVDEQLRVYGAEGLRVVDASVMNVIVRGNIAGPVFAIAEKGAEIIKQSSK
ncbi:uncharacterized protein Z518_09019 [Rhinocladiella mackenziei CBS 650.93]|uniref:glucose oxidase n=1 Tax=Rhinocladiella mackenziei CBS 650.93 TaxID=1442369 RepID=A0A0D2I664_9EURO|nr:uncharacterized protein Z518_09019 [Rhinocladiella mackenziei CBS 650.93]KIX01294.1 hypothetical protein Z518_09019 [Rhinocladiella mackenziei CBS 650.93]